MTWPWSRRKHAREFARSEVITELRRAQTTTGGRLDTEPKDASGAVLTGLDLTGADLRLAKLQRADLRRAILNNARFEGADLSWADLDGAQLQNVRFNQARLLDTTFHNADLSGCDFSDVTGLTPSTVRGASSVQGVRWPNGFSPTERSVIGPLLHRGP